MARIKEHPVTQILNLIESLSTDEKRIIFDRVRPAPKPRQKAATTTTRQVLCVDCSLPATAPVHHESRAGSHLFRKPERKPSQKRKAGKEATGFERCMRAGCGKPMDDNAHQLTTSSDYHEFQEELEPASEAKGANA